VETSSLLCQLRIHTGVGMTDRHESGTDERREESELEGHYFIVFCNDGFVGPWLSMDFFLVNQP
jgi:hypothetical protein